MNSRRPISRSLLFVISSAIAAVNAAPAWQKAHSDAADIAPQSIQGNWQGTLNSQFGKMRLVLKVSKAADGALKATMDSPDQGLGDLQIDTFTFKDSYLHFEMKAIQAVFDGGISRDGTEIAGEFR